MTAAMHALSMLVAAMFDCVPLTASLEAMEKDYKGRIEELEHRHHEELFKLKQENYVLSAKVITANTRFTID